MTAFPARADFTADIDDSGQDSGGDDFGGYPTGNNADDPLTDAGATVPAPGGGTYHPGDDDVDFVDRDKQEFCPEAIGADGKYADCEEGERFVPIVINAGMLDFMMGELVPTTTSGEMTVPLGEELAGLTIEIDECHSNTTVELSNVALSLPLTGDTIAANFAAGEGLETAIALSGFSLAADFYLDMPKEENCSSAVGTVRAWGSIAVENLSLTTLDVNLGAVGSDSKDIIVKSTTEYKLGTPSYVKVTVDDYTTSGINDELVDWGATLWGTCPDDSSFNACLELMAQDAILAEFEENTGIGSAFEEALKDAIEESLSGVAAVGDATEGTLFALTMTEIESTDDGESLVTKWEAETDAGTATSCAKNLGVKEGSTDIASYVDAGMMDVYLPDWLFAEATYAVIRQDGVFCYEGEGSEPFDPDGEEGEMPETTVEYTVSLDFDGDLEAEIVRTILHLENVFPQGGVTASSLGSSVSSSSSGPSFIGSAGSLSLHNTTTTTSSASSTAYFLGVQGNLQDLRDSGHGDDALSDENAPIDDTDFLGESEIEVVITLPVVFTFRQDVSGTATGEIEIRGGVFSSDASGVWLEFSDISLSGLEGTLTVTAEGTISETVELPNGDQKAVERSYSVTTEVPASDSELGLETMIEDALKSLVNLDSLTILPPITVAIDGENAVEITADFGEVSAAAGSDGSTLKSVKIPLDWDLDDIADCDLTYYRDSDGDGYGDPESSKVFCEGDSHSGWVSDDTDCNDDESLENPGAAEFMDCDDVVK